MSDNTKSGFAALSDAENQINRKVGNNGYASEGMDSTIQEDEELQEGKDDSAM